MFYQFVYYFLINFCQSIKKIFNYILIFYCEFSNSLYLSVRDVLILDVVDF